MFEDMSLEQKLEFAQDNTSSDNFTVTLDEGDSKTPTEMDVVTQFTETCEVKQEKEWICYNLFNSELGGNNHERNSVLNPCAAEYVPSQVSDNKATNGEWFVESETGFEEAKTESIDVLADNDNENMDNEQTSVSDNAEVDNEALTEQNIKL